MIRKLRCRFDERFMCRFDGRKQQQQQQRCSHNDQNKSDVPEAPEPRRNSKPLIDNDIRFTGEGDSDVVMDVPV